MKNFLKTILAVILGNTVFYGILFFMLIIMAVAVGVSMSGKTKDKEITGTKILNLDIRNGLSDLSENSDMKLNFGGGNEHTASIFDVLDGIKKAKNDKEIKALWIVMNYNEALSYAQLDLLRKAIQDFKASKKPVIAYGEVVSQKMYYLACAADKIFINPSGGMDVRGFGAQLMFFKKTLEKLEIEPQIFYAGKFKSATEPFRLDKMSEENKTQIKALLSDISLNVLSSIAKDREISVESLNMAINTMESNIPVDALNSKLIDGVKYRDEAEAELKSMLKLGDSDDLGLIGLSKYMKSDLPEMNSGNIAVYVAEGDIVDGKAEDDAISSENMVKAIRSMAKDDDIKAVVLRVNSPGGSALASDIILRELEILKKKKPLVVSMGNVAASGGYYISSNANKIFAEQNTITGSIGVFGIIPNMGKLMQNKLGVTFDEVELNEHAAMGLYKGLDATEGAKIQKEIEKIYIDFKTVVSKGRNIPIEKVEEIAQGRVWSGTKAKELQLVDEIGDLSDAVAYASTLIKSKNADYYFYNSRKSDFELLMDEFAGGEESGASIEEKWLKKNLGDYAKYYDMLKSFDKVKGAQMRMVYQIIGL